MGINQSYIKIFIRWLQMDSGSPLGINFGGLMGFLFVCLSTKICSTQKPLVKKGKECSLSDKALRTQDLVFFLTLSYHTWLYLFLHILSS